MSRRLATLLLAPGLLIAAAAHAASGYIGISVSVDGEGFFLNPTLKSARVAKVAPQSPAQRAGITEGDLILEVEGRKVQGAKASELKPYMDRVEGQEVRFLLKKPSGEERQVTVTAGPKP
jgi:C-terminal processing protease CtpA/Prc